MLILPPEIDISTAFLPQNEWHISVTKIMDLKLSNTVHRFI